MLKGFCRCVSGCFGEVGHKVVRFHRPSIDDFHQRLRLRQRKRRISGLDVLVIVDDEGFFAGFDDKLFRLLLADFRRLCDFGG